METAEVSKGLDGDKPYQKWGRKVLPILVRQAKAGKTIYYSDLAREVGIPNPRNLNYPLGSVGTTLMELADEWEEEIPQIQCIVVSKTTELPGEGIGWFISDEKAFAKLNSKQKRALVDGVCAKVFGYDYWDTVLDNLGLEPIEISARVKKKVKKAASSSGNGGGEGELHKKLKLYIKDNPDSVRIKPDGLDAVTEKSLPSGDAIDVFFENKKNWIGVEVKSEISDKVDILRGLYQCVKYHAVMESHLSVLESNRDAKVILALGGKFPEKLIPIKNVLGIEVIDNISS